MANESTAIHNLLDGLSRKAIPDDPDDDLLFAGSRNGPRKPAARPAGMFTLPPPPAPEPPRAYPLPGVSPFAAPPAAPAPARMAHGTQHPPFSHVPAARPSATTQPEAWPVVARSAYPVAPPSVDPSYLATYRVPKSSRWVVPNKKLYILPAALGALALVLAGVILVRGQGGSPAAATSAAVGEPGTAPAIVQLPVAAPTADPPAKQELPSDAVVPPPAVPASAFAARAEETMPTVAPAAPAAIAEAAPATVPAPAAMSAPASAPTKAAKASKRQRARERHAKRAAKSSASRSARVAAAEPAAKSDAKSEDLGGNGALAITSGTPREVWVDGRNSKRSTPLRVVMTPGKHTVTLFDKEHGSAKSFDVEIKANATLKVAK